MKLLLAMVLVGMTSVAQAAEIFCRGNTDEGFPLYLQVLDIGDDPESASGRFYAATDEKGFEGLDSYSNVRNSDPAGAPDLQGNLRVEGPTGTFMLLTKIGENTYDGKFCTSSESFRFGSFKMRDEECIPVKCAALGLEDITF